MARFVLERHDNSPSAPPLSAALCGERGTHTKKGLYLKEIVLFPARQSRDRVVTDRRVTSKAATRDA